MRPAQLKGGASGFKFEGFAKVTMDVKCSRASILRSSFVKFSSSCGHLVRGSRSFQEFHRFHRFHMFGSDHPESFSSPLCNQNKRTKGDNNEDTCHPK
jgi:hypothetical protein